MTFFPGSNPHDISKALDQCDAFEMGAIGAYLVNPQFETSRQEIARTYWYLWERRSRFDKLQAVYLPPMPGTPLWEPYQRKYKLKGDDLEHQPWHQFDPERYSPSGPLLNRSLDNLSFQPIMQNLGPGSRPRPDCRRRKSTFKTRTGTSKPGKLRQSGTKNTYNPTVMSWMCFWNPLLQ